MNNSDDRKESEAIRTDCEVCQKLVREKHRYDYVWKILCIIFLAVAIIFAILFFANDSAFKKETNIGIKSSGNDNTINGDGNIIVGSDDIKIIGTMEEQDYTPIICITIIASAIVIVGGIVIATHNKKDD